MQRLHEIAEALAELDAGDDALAHGDERRRLLREQAYLLSALADVDRGDQSLN